MTPEQFRSILEAIPATFQLPAYGERRCRLNRPCCRLDPELGPLFFVQVQLPPSGEWADLAILDQVGWEILARQGGPPGPKTS